MVIIYIDFIRFIFWNKNWSTCLNIVCTIFCTYVFITLVTLLLQLHYISTSLSKLYYISKSFSKLGARGSLCTSLIKTECARSFCASVISWLFAYMQVVHVNVCCLSCYASIVMLLLYCSRNAYHQTLVCGV